MQHLTHIIIINSSMSVNFCWLGNELGYKVKLVLSVPVELMLR